uniref:Uncharacterized protein n=1 Tax=Physcomitrium patens TaxID=3218 RepID=A0A2K1ILT1_PHYPA|nr:hypothetical protein PHYPA_026550 [Physcomitrium patens]
MNQLTPSMFSSVAKKVDSLDREDSVDIDAIRERLSKRLGKDIHRFGNLEPFDTKRASKEDLRNIKQKLCDRFKHIKLPTLCGARYRHATSFRARDIPEEATSTYAIVLSNQKVYPNLCSK